MDSEQMGSLTEKYGDLIKETFSEEQRTQLASGCPFWKLSKGYGDSINSRKLHLLSVILQDFPNSFLYVDDDVSSASEVGGSWEPITEKLWRLPPKVNISVLYTSLYEGDWQIYKTAIADFVFILSGIESFKYNFRRVTDYLSENKILFVLESNADNDPWYFGINPDVDFLMKAV